MKTHLVEKSRQVGLDAQHVVEVGTVNAIVQVVHVTLGVSIDNGFFSVQKSGRGEGRGHVIPAGLAYHTNRRIDISYRLVYHICELQIFTFYFS